MANQINSLVNKTAAFIVENSLQNSSQDENVRLFINDIIRKVWDDLKHSAQNFGLEQIMSDLEDSLVKSQQADGQFPVDFSDDEREALLKNNVNTLFRNLAHEFQAETVHGHVVPVDLASYARLQQSFDEALQIIWDSRLSPILDYNGPQLTTPAAIKAWLDDPAHAAQLNAVQTLDLSKLGLKVIPYHITKLSQLQFLLLDNNQISSIPASLSNLISLQSLSLNNNQISSIPDSLANLARLRELYLCNNQISSIPDSLSKLTQLQTLSLNNNRISGIPDSVGNLSKLKTLSLYNNQISSIPAALSNLVQLEFLRLNNNQIKKIPDSLGNLAKLRGLYLDHNQIKKIPDSLNNAAWLHTLAIDHNPISRIPDLSNLTRLQWISLIVFLIVIVHGTVNVANFLNENS
jgi:Leucine-rich repeat (LRR) protein